MDQQNTNQNTQPQAPKNLVTNEQKDQLFKELGLEGLPEERKQALMEKMTDTVLNRIFTRISPALSDEDAKTLEQLETQPDADIAVNQYILSRVPSFNAIAQEEIEKFREEMKQSVSAIKSALPQ